MPTVAIGGVNHDLVPPGKMSERWAPINAMRPGCEVLVMAAALGLCAPLIRRHVHYHHDVFAFGAAVIDFLTAPERRERNRQADGSFREVRPATMAEVITAGGQALGLCRLHLVDLEGAADFTAPPGPTPTSGGPSSGGGSMRGNF